MPFRRPIIIILFINKNVNMNNIAAAWAVDREFVYIKNGEPLLFVVLLLSSSFLLSSFSLLLPSSFLLPPSFFLLSLSFYAGLYRFCILVCWALYILYAFMLGFIDSVYFYAGLSRFYILLCWA